jgi:hypothetical protein
MQILLLFLAVVCTIIPSKAQHCIIQKGYAFQRATIPGNIPRTLDESGKVIEAPVKMMNTYFIFVETKNNCNLRSTRIWLARKAYNITREEIINMPVVIQPSHPGSAPDTLVKQTDNKVYRIEMKEESKTNPPKQIMKMQTETNIIIEYTNRSRTEYFQIKEIKRIAPMVLQ